MESFADRHGKWRECSGICDLPTVTEQGWRWSRSLRPFCRGSQSRLGQTSSERYQYPFASSKSGQADEAIDVISKAGHGSVQPAQQPPVRTKREQSKSKRRVFRRQILVPSQSARANLPSACWSLLLMGNQSTQDVTGNSRVVSGGSHDRM